MIKFYRTDHKVLSEITEYEDNMWVCMTKPTVDETKLIAEDFEIDLADVRAALDDEESSRVEVEDGYTLILVDIPSIEVRNEREAYTTIPLGIILVKDILITHKNTQKNERCHPGTDGGRVQSFPVLSFWRLPVWTWKHLPRISE